MIAYHDAMVALWDEFAREAWLVGVGGVLTEDGRPAIALSVSKSAAHVERMVEGGRGGFAVLVRDVRDSAEGKVAA